MRIEFGGQYAYKHQIPLVIDSSKLRKERKPLKEAPKVKRDIPTKNYCIAQQEWGKQLFVLLKEDPGTHRREPVIPSFFTKEWRLIPGGIEIQRTKTSHPQRLDELRQK